MKFLSIIAKILAGIALLFVLLVGGLYLFAKNAIPTALGKFVYDKTGFTLHWDKFDIQGLRGRVELKNFRIENPKSFETSAFVTLPSVIIDSDLASLKKEPYRIEDLTVHLAEVAVVTNKNGQTNIELLQAGLKDPKMEAKKELEKSQNKTEKQPEVLFKHIKLQVDSVKLVNYTVTPTKETTLNINFAFERENLTTEQLKGELQMALMPIVLKNMGPAAFQESFGTALGGIGIASDAFGKGFKAGSAAASEGVDATTESAKKAAEGIKETFKGLKGMFKKE